MTATKRPNRKATYAIILGSITTVATSLVNSGVTLPKWLAPIPPVLVALATFYQTEGEADEVTP